LLTSSVALKYKEYNKVRDILAGKVKPHSSKSHHSSPEKRKSIPVTTPLKRVKHAETPSKAPTHGGETYMNSPDISRKLFSPKPVTSLGPTPQRDGRVLGLFDLLVERELGSPSKRELENWDTPRKSKIHATPSKRRLYGETLDGGSPAGLGKTPTSAGKRQRREDAFATPLKKRDANAAGAATPSSVSKLQLETPAFLKRYSITTTGETGSETLVSSLRLPRKPFSRGLSEIVASLRKVEEERLDDELEALREMEAEEMGLPAPRPMPQQQHRTDGYGPDEQQPFRQGADGDFAAVEEAIAANEQPTRTYKKKGQKRTTRFVNMKPTKIQRPDVMPGSERRNGGGGDDGEFDGEGDDGFEDGSDSDFDGKSVAKKRQAPVKKGEGEKKPSAVKKSVRKVNELAHANFQRLKLKNRGNKGGPSHNSRFRRRR
jgi:DNA replication regulator SLD2